MVALRKPGLRKSWAYRLNAGNTSRGEHHNSDHSLRFSNAVGIVRACRETTPSLQGYLWPATSTLEKHRGWKSICRELQHSVLNFARERRVGFCPVTKSSETFRSIFETQGRDARNKNSTRSGMLINDYNFSRVQINFIDLKAFNLVKFYCLTMNSAINIWAVILDILFW